MKNLLHSACVAALVLAPVTLTTTSASAAHALTVHRAAPYKVGYHRGYHRGYRSGYAKGFAVGTAYPFYYGYYYGFYVPAYTTYNVLKGVGLVS